jgi:hypothetical protein
MILKITLRFKAFARQRAMLLMKRHEKNNMKNVITRTM